MWEVDRKHRRLPLATGTDGRGFGIRDISPGGLFIETSRPAEIGSWIEFDLALEDGEPPLHLRGEVVRTEPTIGRQAGGMALEFRDLDPETQARIDRLIEMAAANRRLVAPEVTPPTEDRVEELEKLLATERLARREAERRVAELEAELSATRAGGETG